MRIYVVYSEVTAENLRAFCSWESAQEWITENESIDEREPFQVGTLFIDCIDLVN